MSLVNLNIEDIFAQANLVEITDSEDYGLSVKKIQKTKKSVSIRTTIGDKTFKIPISPEDEEDFIPDASGVVDVQTKHGLRKRTAGSTDRKVCFRSCWYFARLFIVGNNTFSELTS
jgi:hypothetical protein